MDVVRFDCLVILKDLSYKEKKKKKRGLDMAPWMENLSIKVEILTGVDDLHALCLIFAFLLGDFDLDLANLNR